jgi:hypothetical protein
MNIYTPQIFEEKLQYTFTPPVIANLTNSNWIEKINLLNFGNGGEILSVEVSAVGQPGLDHGLEKFAFWVARYDFTPLIGLSYQGNRGPSHGDIFLSSGEIAVRSNIALNAHNPIYSQSFINPVPYVFGPNFQLAFTARGVGLSTTINFVFRGRRTQ